MTLSEGRRRVLPLLLLGCVGCCSCTPPPLPPGVGGGPAPLAVGRTGVLRGYKVKEGAPASAVIQGGRGFARPRLALRGGGVEDAAGGVDAWTACFALAFINVMTCTQIANMSYAMRALCFQVTRKERLPDPERGPDAYRTSMHLGNDNNDQQVCPPDYDLVDKDPMLWYRAYALGMCQTVNRGLLMGLHAHLRDHGKRFVFNVTRNTSFNIIEYGLRSGPLDASIDRLQMVFPSRAGKHGSKNVTQSVLQTIEHEWIYLRGDNGVTFGLDFGTAQYGLYDYIPAIPRPPSLRPFNTWALSETHVPEFACFHMHALHSDYRVDDEEGDAKFVSLSEKETGLKVANGPYDPPSVRVLYGEGTQTLSREDIEAMCVEADGRANETDESLQEGVTQVLKEWREVGGDAPPGGGGGVQGGVFGGLCTRLLYRRTKKMLAQALNPPSPGDDVAEPVAGEAAGSEEPALGVWGGEDAGSYGEDGLTAIHWAAWHGHLETVKILAQECGMPVGQGGDGRGQTSLHWAALNGHHAAVRLLLSECGARVDAVDLQGLTPLHAAAAKNHSETVKVLVEEFGADVHTSDRDGMGVAHWAAQGGHVDLLLQLIKKYGASVDARDSEGRTPLHIAALVGDVDTIKVLVHQCGANVDALDYDGLSPIESAASNDHKGAVTYLARECNAKLVDAPPAQLAPAPPLPPGDDATPHAGGGGGRTKSGGKESRAAAEGSEKKEKVQHNAGGGEGAQSAAARGGLNQRADDARDRLKQELGKRKEAQEGKGKDADAGAKGKAEKEAKRMADLLMREEAESSHKRSGSAKEGSGTPGAKKGEGRSHKKRI